MDWEGKILQCVLRGKGVKTEFVRVGVSGNVEPGFIDGGPLLVGRKKLADGRTLVERETQYLK